MTTAHQGLSPYGDAIVKDTEEVLNKALDYTRTLMTELRPPVLQKDGLAAGLKCAFPFFLPTTERSCFQSIRGLLVNALKHADAKEVAIRMKWRRDAAHRGAWQRRRLRSCCCFFREYQYRPVFQNRTLQHP